MTIEEVVLLGTDRTSLPTREPIGNASTVRILVNDEYFIPQGGLSVPAHIFSNVSGPFDLKEGFDVLTIATPKGTFTTSFGIVGVNRLTTDQIIQYLLRKNFDVGMLYNANGYLEFGDISTVGPDSFVRVSGSAATSLGFGEVDCGTNGVPRSATGKVLYPGWQLYVPPNTITVKYPKFVRPVKTNPVFKVNYGTTVNRCLRCQATFVENDYRFDPNGQTLMIENENLLYQAALKILLTDKGSNQFYPWYGSNIRSRIGSKALSGVANLINEDVRQALTRFQSLQEGQAKYQTVTYQERLYSIVAVNVMPHAQDPTTYMVDVTVQNASAEPISLTIVYTVPNVVALMGSNGLMLGTEAAGLGQSIINIPNSPLALINPPQG
jgi:phage baseplate assembly protein W